MGWERPKVLVEANVKTKLIAVASWIALVVSTVAEYGRGENCLFTPTTWMAISICAFELATNDVAKRSWIQDCGTGDMGADWLCPIFICHDSVCIHNPASLQVSSPTVDRHIHAHASCRGICPNDIYVPVSHRPPFIRGGRIVIARHPIPFLVVLEPGTTRAPPSGSDRRSCLLEGTVDRPPRRFHSAASASEARFAKFDDQQEEDFYACE